MTEIYDEYQRQYWYGVEVEESVIVFKMMKNKISTAGRY